MGDDYQSNSDTYVLSKPVDTSYMGVKRIKVTADLKTQKIDKEQIFDILHKIIDTYKDDADIIQMSVKLYIESELANKESMSKEIVAAVWVSPALDELKQRPLENSEGNGLYWKDVQGDLFSMQNYQVAVSFGKSDTLLIATFLKIIGGCIKSFRYALRKKKTKQTA